MFLAKIRNFYLIYLRTRVTSRFVDVVIETHFEPTNGHYLIELFVGTAVTFNLPLRMKAILCAHSLS